MTTGPKTGSILAPRIISTPSGRPSARSARRPAGPRRHRTPRGLHDLGEGSGGLARRSTPRRTPPASVLCSDVGRGDLEAPQARRKRVRRPSAASGRRARGDLGTMGSPASASERPRLRLHLGEIALRAGAASSGNASAPRAAPAANRRAEPHEGRHRLHRPRRVLEARESPPPRRSRRISSGAIDRSAGRSCPRTPLHRAASAPLRSGSARTGELCDGGPESDEPVIAARDPASTSVKRGTMERSLKNCAVTSTGLRGLANGTSALQLRLCVTFGHRRHFETHILRRIGHEHARAAGDRDEAHAACPDG